MIIFKPVDKKEMPLKKYEPIWDDRWLWAKQTNESWEILIVP